MFKSNYSSSKNTSTRQVGLIDVLAFSGVNTKVKIALLGAFFNAKLSINKISIIPILLLRPRTELAFTRKAGHPID